MVLIGIILHMSEKSPNELWMQCLQLRVLPARFLGNTVSPCLSGSPGLSPRRCQGSPASMIKVGVRVGLLDILTSADQVGDITTEGRATTRPMTTTATGEAMATTMAMEEATATLILHLNSIVY